jgi:hypothetical protein
MQNLALDNQIYQNQALKREVSLMGQKPDMCSAKLNVRSVSKADICSAAAFV